MTQSCHFFFTGQCHEQWLKQAVLFHICLKLWSKSHCVRLKCFPNCKSWAISGESFVSSPVPQEHSLMSQVVLLMPISTENDYPVLQLPPLCWGQLKYSTSSFKTQFPISLSSADRDGMIWMYKYSWNGFEHGSSMVTGCCVQREDLPCTRGCASLKLLHQLLSINETRF